MNSRKRFGGWAMQTLTLFGAALGIPIGYSVYWAMNDVVWGSILGCAADCALFWGGFLLGEYLERPNAAEEAHYRLTGRYY